MGWHNPPTWRREWQPHRQRSLAGSYHPWGHGRVRRDLTTEKQQHPPCEVNMVENTETLIRIEEVKHRPS